MHLLIYCKVLRLAGTIGTAQVSWEVEENQTDGLDIINQSGVLTFQSGEASRPLELQVQGETVPELDETIYVKLLAATGVTLRTAIIHLSKI